MAGGVEVAIKALEYIKNNPEASHSARAVAKVVGVSDVALISSVKKHLGLSWTEFVKRIEEGDATILMAHLQAALQEKHTKKKKADGGKGKKKTTKEQKADEEEQDEGEEVLPEERIIASAMAKEAKKDLSQIGAMEYNAAFALGGELMATYGRVASAMGLDVREYIHRAVRFYETYRGIILDLEEELKKAHATIESMRARLSFQTYFDNVIEQLMASKLAGALNMSVQEIFALAYMMATERERYLNRAMKELPHLRGEGHEGGSIRVGGNESRTIKDGAGYGANQGGGYKATPPPAAPPCGDDQGGV